ncbi:TPT-domain-containing protein [Hesseltinella vesiculosa]|uniref:TPT-domain-containing protein n=1 Tax=Hesseltinella vesiculosa TaxID=101127 RepID=A0A1X2GTP7_9FUNG|nr:TPT-domain-containing protein [Hesseltinella vesiculosa]
MVKSSTPVWVLLFSFMFGFEKPRWRLVMIIFVIVSGVFLTVEGETKFDTLGFTLVLVAAVASGLRWNMTQLLLQQDRLGIHSPIATLYYLSPIMFVTMLFLSLVIEHPIDQFRYSGHFDNAYHVVESFGLMAIGGLLAFAMTLSELYLIKNTNTVTLSVAGISKEVVVISLSVLIYGDVLTSKTILGLIVSIAGIIWYNYYKLTKQSNNDKGQYQMIPLPLSKNLED